MMLKPFPEISDANSIQVIRNIDNNWMQILETLDPANPFHTRQYITSQKNGGHEVFLLVYFQKRTPTAACAGYVTHRRFRNSIEILTTPQMPDDPELWKDFEKFVHRNHIRKLHFKTFASSEYPMFPELKGRTMVTPRHEYVLNLKKKDLWAGISKNHKRNIKKANRYPIEVVITKLPDACIDHVNMITATMDRRQNRGEDVDTFFDVRWYQKLLECGCGELYQARLQEETISSVLIIRADKGAYYHSAGTCSDGMAAGISHSLVFEIATRLQNEGLDLFNLGGTEEDNPGLVRFKAGFGTDSVALEHRCYFFDNSIQKIARFFLR